MSRGINNGNIIFFSLKFPESDINGDTTLTLGLEFVKNPGVLEGSLAKVGRLLLKLLDGTLVDATALVQQVTSGRRLSCHQPTK